MRQASLIVPRCRRCGQACIAGRRCRSCDAPERRTREPSMAEVLAIVAENPNGMTLDEIGQVLGVTRERVRQIEFSALRKLRLNATRATREHAETEPPAAWESTQMVAQFRSLARVGRGGGHG